jgi:PKD repeat protein
MLTKINSNALLWCLSFFFISFFIGCSKSAPEAPTPVASFTWTASNLTVPSTVTFTNTSTNGSSYQWDFGDGGSSTNFSPTHTYTTGGTYIVKLTVTGRSGTITTNQTVNLAKPTALQITVKDNLGNPVSGAIVRLYSTLTDWTNETNQTFTPQTSNTTGVVTFSPLSAISYYWKITSGCQNNIFGSNTTTTALSANTTTAVTSVIAGTGIIALTNASSNPYDVFINGTLQVSSMPGSTSKNLIAPVGSYSIRILQKSGYLITPTDKTYTGNVQCGGTLLVNFP